MDAKVFIEALNQLEEQKGIRKEAIIEALKEALHKALEKQLSGGHSNDGDIRVTITEDPAEIKMEYVRKVVEEVEDDYLEISVEEANAGKKGKKYQVGDEFVEEKQVGDMTRIIALTVKSVLRQKLAEAEKQALYELYKDKVNEMITGTIETCDDKGAMVKIGLSSSLFLSRKELIGDETFKAGDTVRVYVSNVSEAEAGKSAMVRISRSDAGFLRRLFEEEVREIYDGTVIIKNLAREAGVRAKIAVYSNDANVDPVGCCIGSSGNAIQKIVAQLGNAREKEKIDVIQYSPNDALFIIDALRPATVTKIGIYTDDKNKKCAIAIVPDGQLSLAIGRKGANVRVASKLTDTHIDIKEESMASDVLITLKSVETIQEEEKERVRKEKYEKYLSQIKSQRKEETVSSTGLEKAKPQQILDEDVKEEVKSTVTPVEEKVEEVVTPVEEVKPVAKQTVVRTTTTLESLEASLESDKKKESFKATSKTSKRPRKIEEDEVAHEEVKTSDENKQQMAIYTQEELEEMENEEIYEDDYEEEIDYDDYEEYYDDDDK